MRRIELAISVMLAALLAAPALAQNAPLVRFEVKAGDVPRSLSAEAAKQHDCRPDVVSSGIEGYRVSAERAIWEIPCDRFAYNTSSVFVAVLQGRTGEYRFLTFEGSPGRKRDQPFILINAAWDEKARTVSAFNKGRGLGDCGTYEVHQVMPEGGFQLSEYREKKACDGKDTAPESYPLVWKRR